MEMKEEKVDLEKFTIYGWVELNGTIANKDGNGNVLLFIQKPKDGKRYKKVFLKTLHHGKSKNKMKDF